MSRVSLLRRLRLLAWLGLCGLLLGLGLPVMAAPEPATLSLLNRELVTFRAPLGGASPAQRVERARERLLALPPAEIDGPLRALPYRLGDASGVQILVGDRLLFALLEEDLEPELRHEGLEPLQQQTLERLTALRQAWHESQDRPRLWQGLLHAALASLAALAAAWALARATRWLMAWLEARRRALASSQLRVDWRELLARALGQSLRLLQGGLMLLLFYAWVEAVLGAFVLTQPLAHRLGDWLLAQLLWVLRGLGAGLPGVMTVVIVLVLTRALADVIGYFFSSVQRGRLSLRLLHPETAPATRRIVTGLVWAVGLAIAYPYLPGADSEAFKGISVLLGLMVTLGSAGIVTQAMSGLVVIYARALRRGDYVQIGEVEGVVTEVAPLATKLLNLRNEEITIPNAVLIAQPIHNYSRLADSQGTLLSTQLSIGYDVPWRQVHALLEQAARATPGLRAQPAPRVFQRALGDFYVEYELMVSIEHALDRIPVLSALHGQIQDAFREAGVQIMSPHFLAQPETPVIPKA